jgi:hypothetical protein
LQLGVFVPIEQPREYLVQRVPRRPHVAELARLEGVEHAGRPSGEEATTRRTLTLAHAREQLSPPREHAERAAARVCHRECGEVVADLVGVNATVKVTAGFGGRVKVRMRVGVRGRVDGGGEGEGGGRGVRVWVRG